MALGTHFPLLLRILDTEDYQYVRMHDLALETRLRRGRMKIYRRALRQIASGVGESYHARLANLSAAGAWSSYPGLVWGTASSFFSIGKLWIAGNLFALRLPVLVDLAAQRDRIEKFLVLSQPSA